MAKRLPVPCDNQGRWLPDKRNQTTSRKVALNTEMRKMKKQWARRHGRE